VGRSDTQRAVYSGALLSLWCDRAERASMARRWLLLKTEAADVLLVWHGHGQQIAGADRWQGTALLGRRAVSNSVCTLGTALPECAGTAQQAGQDALLDGFALVLVLQAERLVRGGLRTWWQRSCTVRGRHQGGTLAVCTVMARP